MDPRPVNPGPQRSPDDDTPRPDAAAPNQCKPGELGPVPTGWSHASSPEAAEATEMGHEPALESNDEDDATFRDASRGPRLQKCSALQALARGEHVKHSLKMAK